MLDWIDEISAQVLLLNKAAALEPFYLSRIPSEFHKGITAMLRLSNVVGENKNGIFQRTRTHRICKWNNTRHIQIQFASKPYLS
jgi:hypothetical protein